MLKKILFFLGGFPLYLVSVSFLIYNYSNLWLICLLMTFVLHITVFFCSKSIFSSFELLSFYKEFIGKNRNFKLKLLERTDNISLDIEEEFSLLSFLSSLREKTYKYFKWEYSPIYFFYAVPIDTKVLSSSKAYVFSTLLSIIICRSDKINKNAFEEFLFYHELEHINDVGGTNYSDNSKLISSTIINLICGLFFIYHAPSQLWFYLLAAYILIYEGSIFLVCKRESIADLVAIAKIRDVNVRARLIQLLIQWLNNESNRVNWYLKRIMTYRVNELVKYKELLLSNSFDQKGITKFKASMIHNSKFNVPVYFTLFNYGLLMTSTSKGFENINPHLMLVLLIILIMFFVFTFFITLKFSSVIEHEVRKYISRFFSDEELRLSFTYQIGEKFKDARGGYASRFKEFYNANMQKVEQMMKEND